MERQKDFPIPDDKDSPTGLANFLIHNNQGPTRQGVQNLLNAAKALSEKPNDLALELYRLLDEKGREGVRQKINEILARQGADMQNFRANAALTAAVRHFRAEADRDPSSKAAIILKIIEQTA